MTRQKLFQLCSALLVLTSLLLTSGCNELESAEDNNAVNDSFGTRDPDSVTEPEQEESSPEEESELPPESLDKWYKVSHPQMNDSEDEFVQACFQMGERDKKFGVNYFIVAFEGLASFNQSSSNKLYDHFENNPLMDDRSAPSKSGSGGFMVYHLLWPVMTQAGAGADVMVFSEPSVSTDQKNSKPELCARAWLAGNSKGHLIVTGHSYGGHAANQLADILDKKNIPIDTVITVDARTKRYVGDLFKTDNADLWLNFYQKNTLFLPGYLVDGANANINLSSTGTSHGKIPSRPEVRAALLESLTK